MTKIYAHRGASAVAPENTMAAFKKAIEMGADGVELDVHLSKDGELIVAHDETLERVSNGTGRIVDYTLEELRAFNFAMGKWEGFEPQQVPTLREVYALLKPTGMGINVEIKSGIILYEGIEQKLLELAREMGMEDRVLYSSFNHYSLKLLQALDPSVKIGLLYGEALYEPWQYAGYVKADAIHPYYFTLQAPGVVEKCHENGIMVNPWTVDDPKHIAWMFSLGVDILITDKPDLAREIMEGKTT